MSETSDTITELQELPELPLELRRARRVLEGHDEIAIIEDWRWYAPIQRWALQCLLTPAGHIAVPSLQATKWFVLADQIYPWGRIDIYPAKDGGIADTYPHQLHNSVGEAALPWRTGLLCLGTERRILGRQGYDEEPHSAGARLLWNLERALAWIRAAAAGTLAGPGDPFELPDFSGALLSPWRLGFLESAATFAQWQQSSLQAGLVDLQSFAAAYSAVLLVTGFRTPQGHVIRRTSWGTLAAYQRMERGAWIRLPACPILTPWQAPFSWGELRQACHIQGHDLDVLLQQVLPELRDGRSHMLMVGFPIPETVGSQNCRMHWQGLRLPVISHRTQTMKGFRPAEPGYWHRDRQEVLHDHVHIDWLSTENWEQEYLASRGRLPMELIQRRILLIGAGALGSAVAELLVRGGITDGVVIDGERLEAGNLVRHSLTLGEVSREKASALAERLNRISPHASFRAIEAAFPPRNREHERWVQGCDMVIDCTGDDTVIEQLAAFPWDGDKLFISLSIGYQARRFWCFSAVSRTFSSAAFRAHMDPWLAQERRESGEVTFPREGIGCWHPVFPARADDISLWASVAVKRIEMLRTTNYTGVSLAVYEQDSASGSFGGVRKLAGRDGIEDAS